MTSRSEGHCPTCGVLCFRRDEYTGPCAACVHGAGLAPWLSVAEQERLFAPAPEPMPGQTELDTPEGWDG